MCVPAPSLSLYRQHVNLAGGKSADVTRICAHACKQGIKCEPAVRSYILNSVLCHVFMYGWMDECMQGRVANNNYFHFSPQSVSPKKCPDSDCQRFPRKIFNLQYREKQQIDLNDSKII